MDIQCISIDNRLEIMGDSLRFMFSHGESMEYPRVLMDILCISMEDLRNMHGYL